MTSTEPITATRSATGEPAEPPRDSSTRPADPTRRPPPAAGALSASSVGCSCGPGRWSWGRRRLLGAAGVNQEILAQCPTEVDKYVGLGAAVVISSAMAVVSGSVAVATALAGGQPSLGTWLACIPIGVCYGAVVFAIDRFLVSAPINSVDLDRGTTRQRRGPQAARTLAGVAPRLVLAALIGVLVAEPVLLVIFRSEVDQRVAQVQEAEHAQQANRIEADYEAELGRISGRESELAGVDPAVAAARADLADVDDEITDAETGLAELQVTLRNEISGVTVGAEDTATSGRVGDGPVADQIRAEIDLLEARLDGLRQRRATRQQAVDDITATSGGDPGDGKLESELAELGSERRRLDQQRTGDLAAIDTTTVDGLLIRVEALEWLTQHRLDTTATAPGTGTGGDGLTTVGLAVWLVRLWVLLLDAIPVAFKAMMSLRAQRPYDTMVAAHAAAELKLAHQIARSTPAPHSHIPAEPIEPPAEPSKPNGDRPNGSGPTLGATGRSLRASSNAQLVRRLAATHPDWTQAKLGETVGLSTRQVRRYLTSTSNGHEPDPQQAGHETGHRTGHQSGHEADITPDTKNESALVTRQPGIVR